MVGLLNVDKPLGMSSAQAVGRLRRASGEKRVGHGGTLDPAASGVLPVLFGRATLLAGFFTGQQKSYVAQVRLGAVSSTDDREGRISVSRGACASLDEAAVRRVAAEFQGTIQQRPPAYSAIKVEGRRSYSLARERDRAGEAAAIPTVTLDARSVEVHSIEVTSMVAGTPGPLVTIDVRCGSGFYVRSLARDLGERLGCGGYLEGLRRTAVGYLRAEDAISLDEAIDLGPEVGARFIAVAGLLARSIEVRVGTEAIADLVHGRAVAAPGAAPGEAYASDNDGAVMAIGEVRDGAFHPRRLVEAG